VSYTFIPSATNNDVCQLWINPDPATFGSPIAPPTDLANSDGSDLQSSGSNQIESFLFRQVGASPPSNPSGIARPRAQQRWTSAKAGNANALTGT
jgi:hypothetical protein